MADSLTPSCYLPPPTVEGIGRRGRPQTRELVPTPLRTRVRARAHAQTPHPASAGDAMLLWTVLIKALTHGVAIGVRVTRAGVRVESNRFFKKAQQRVVAPLVPSALDATNTST